MLSFTDQHNRSERSLQVQVLVPALVDPQVRFDLLSSLDRGGAEPVTREETDAASIWHFVWVLRDQFYWERSEAAGSKTWVQLRDRWRQILGLPDWVAESGWWRHPSGSYQGDENYVVHPCHRLIGWIPPAIRARAFQLHLSHDAGDAVDVLTHARRILNTECDCFIQTERRLIVIECKDKTSFSDEQSARQADLRDCLERLYPRANPPIYAEVSQIEAGLRRKSAWTWRDLRRRITAERDA